MNVILIGLGNKKLLLDIYENLLKVGVDAELFDPLEGYYFDSNNFKVVFGKTISSKNFFIKNILLYRNFIKGYRLLARKKFDVCNIHFLDIRYFFFKKYLIRLARKLIISIYGTDFNKYRKFSFFQKYFYFNADFITFANEVTLSNFDKFYDGQFSFKLKICRFGLSLLPELKKMQGERHKKITSDFNFPSDKILITVGYNSNINNQQIQIINELNQLDYELKKKIFIIFPMTYGGFASNINSVRIAMDDSLIDYKILTSFLSESDLLLLRIQSDIMINLPINDQLSATMCEYIYTRNWVITGAWLPYEIIDKTGLRYDRINSIKQLHDRLTEIIYNFERYKNLTARNPEKIWSFTSWEQNIKQWIDVYSA